MLVQHCTTPVLYRFVVVAGWIRTTISGRGCLRERIHAQLLHINQSYPLMEADKVANVSLTLHKASTAPFLACYSTQSYSETTESLSRPTYSRTTLADLTILITFGAI